MKDRALSNRVYLISSVLLFLTQCGLVQEFLADPPPEGYEYNLIAAQSARSIDNPMYLSNLNGQIGLVYDLKRVARASDYGISGSIWRGRPIAPATTFQITLDDSNTGAKYRGQKMAYDFNGKDNTINLKDADHHGLLWEMASVSPEWFKKYRLPGMRPFHLRATEGEFKGYYLTFEEPELVKIDEDRSYVRRRAVLTKEPTELSVFLKQEHRER